MIFELIYDRIFNDPEGLVVGESTASQLPGRWNGGAADAYRHILFAAELTRDYGPRTALGALNGHEGNPESGADNGLDMWNNAIGIKIGEYVRKQDGDWQDIVRLSRAVISSSFDGPGYDQIAEWNIKEADDGIRQTYNLHTELLNGRPETFEKFAKRLKLNRDYAFRANDKSIILEDGKLELFPVAMTSPTYWANHPKVEVDGKEVELEIESSAFPTIDWFTGKGFVYEDGNAAPPLSYEATQFPGIERGPSSSFRSDATTHLPNARPAGKADVATHDAAIVATDSGLGISDDGTRLVIAGDTLQPGSDADAVASQHKKPGDTMSDVGLAQVGGRIATESEEGLSKYGMPTIENGLSRTETGMQDTARQKQKSQRFVLKPNVQRLLSGDLSKLGSEKERFSPNLLRLLMGGSVPRVRGATQLEDIARQPANRLGS